MNHMLWQYARPSNIIFKMALMRASERYTVLVRTTQPTRGCAPNNQGIHMDTAHL